jgi:hypothetical protein
MVEVFVKSYNNIQDNDFLDSNSNYYSKQNSDLDKDYYYYLPNLVHLDHINHIDLNIVEHNYRHHHIVDDDDYSIQLLK